MIILLVLFLYLQNLVSLNITDKINIRHYTVENYVKPESIDALQFCIKNYKAPFSIRGQGFSQGGQTITQKGTVIDLSLFNKIIFFDQKNQTITVQAGATWRQIEKFIDPFDLSLQGIQSYNDFSVGGSIGVNCHGRDISGSLENSIVSITILTADGLLLQASEKENQELFHACIGGYGLLGIIIDATLKLTTNEKLIKTTKLIPLKSYPAYFKEAIQKNPNTQLHSAIICFDKETHLISTTFFKNHAYSTHCYTSRRLRKHKKLYLIKTGVETLYRRLKTIKAIKSKLESIRIYKELKQKNKYYFRNYEMSQTVQTIEPITRFFSTSVLQEYFIPYEKIVDFVTQLKLITKMYNINLVNTTLRFVPQQKKSTLQYASTDSFACVLYINIINTQSEIKNSKIWTQKIINAALSCNGTYYLPYQLYATKEQFKYAYPTIDLFLGIKKQFDPENKFQNKLFQKYMDH